MRNAAHNAAVLFDQKHTLVKRIADDYAAGKKLDKYDKPENEEVFNRAGTTVSAVIKHIKTVVTVKKEQDNDG